MRPRQVLLVGLLSFALLAPTALALAAHTGYSDPFGPERHCSALRLPRHHVRGMRATPYRVCLLALRRMQSHPRLAARRACRGETRRHVRALRRGTPYSRCVTAGTRLRRGG